MMGTTEAAGAASGELRTVAELAEAMRRLAVGEEPLAAVEMLPPEAPAAGAWAAWGRAEWHAALLGALHRAGALDRRVLVRAAAAAARTAQGDLPDHHPASYAATRALRVAERWADDKVTDREARGAAAEFDRQGTAAPEGANAAAEAARAALNAALAVDVSGELGHAVSCAVLAVAAPRRPARSLEVARALRVAVRWQAVERALRAAASSSSSGGRLAAASPDPGARP